MKIFDFPLIHLPQTESTNSHLKEMLKNESPIEGTVVFAHEQTKGRGQAGCNWESEPGMNLIFSMLLFPSHIAVEKQFILSKIVSFALVDVLNDIQPGFCIKWPNDIYYGDSKIGGILIENEIEDNRICSSIVGIGINVNQTAFMSDAPNPISLKQIIGHDFPVAILMVMICEKLHDTYNESAIPLKIKRIEKRYGDLLYRGNGYHSFWDKNGEFTAAIVGVKPEGYLMLQTAKGDIRQYLFKEVSFTPPHV